MSGANPLIAGFHRRRAREKPTIFPWDGPPRRPHTVVVACSDATLDPERLFDAGPGELFVIRNLAGLVPEYAPDGGCHGTSAALEYAVRILKVRHVVLLGHDGCEGILALINGPLKRAQDFVFPWMEQAEGVIWDFKDTEPKRTIQDQVEDDVLRLSRTNLLGFPWVKDRIEAGSLSLTVLKHEARPGRLVAIEEGARRVLHGPTCPDPHHG